MKPRIVKLSWTNPWGESGGKEYAIIPENISGYIKRDMEKQGCCKFNVEIFSNPDSKRGTSGIHCR